jgi:hypothetical protein
VLRPCASSLFNEIRGLKLNVVKELSEEARVAIVFYRMFLCDALADPLQYRVTWRSLVKQKPRVLMKGDACPLGFGLRLFHIDEDGVVGRVIAVIWFKFDVEQLDFARDNNPAFQNTTGYMCVVVMGLWLHSMGYMGVRYKLKMDSTTALHWWCHDRSQAGPSQREAVLLASLTHETGIGPAAVGEFIPGSENVEDDGISRGYGALEQRYPVGVMKVGHENDFLCQVLSVAHPERTISAANPGLFSLEVREVLRVARVAGEAARAKRGGLFLGDLQRGVWQLFVSAPRLGSAPLSSDGTRSAWEMRVVHDSRPMSSLLEEIYQVLGESAVVVRCTCAKLPSLAALGDQVAGETGLETGDVLEVELSGKQARTRG